MHFIVAFSVINSRSYRPMLTKQCIVTVLISAVVLLSSRSCCRSSLEMCGTTTHLRGKPPEGFSRNARNICPRRHKGELEFLNLLNGPY